MRSLTFLQRHLWLSSRKLAERHLGHARHLLSSQEPADIYSALSLLDAALKLLPQWEKALELKARALLCLRRFKDVANLLYDFIPSLKEQVTISDSSVEKVKLLGEQSCTGPEIRCKKRRISQCFPVFKVRKKLYGKRCERDQWRYLVLGQACCHLGMMEDAMILLLNGKRAASAAWRKQSNRLREDGFFSEEMLGADSDVLNHLLGNIKQLLRRRTAAMAAFEAGLYAESARHFTKILEGRRGTPQGFIAECYLHRAKAYQADGRVTDAIADCNRALILNPICAEALSIRASLYEMVGCLAESMNDLEQLKSLYDTLLLNEELLEPRWIRPQNAPDTTDFQGCIDFISNKIATTRERLMHGGSMVDHHIILGVSRGCSRAELERAYLLLSLKHRPDKAASFVDRCEFVDERGIEFVKDEARSLAMRLSRMIQKAYAGVMSIITEEEASREQWDQAQGQCIAKTLISSIWEHQSQGASGVGDGVVDDLSGHVLEETLSNHIQQQKGKAMGQSNEKAMEQSNGIRIGKRTSKACNVCTDEAFVDDYGLMGAVSMDFQDVLHECKEGEGEGEAVVEEEEVDGGALMVESGLFPQVAACRDMINVGTIISQSLSPDMWMSHQACSPHLLSV